MTYIVAHRRGTHSHAAREKLLNRVANALRERGMTGKAVVAYNRHANTLAAVWPADDSVKGERVTIDLGALPA